MLSRFLSTATRLAISCSMSVGILMLPAEAIYAQNTNSNEAGQQSVPVHTSKHVNNIKTYWESMTRNSQHKKSGTQNK